MVNRWLYDLSVVIRLDTWLYANRRGYTLQAAFQPKTLKIGITTPACSPNARFGPVEASYAWNRLSVDTKQSINQSINRTYNAHNCRKANRRRGDGSEPVAILSSRPTVGLLIEPGLQSRLERRNCSTFLQVPWKTVPDRRCSNAESSTLEIDPDAWQLKKALVRGSEHTTPITPSVLQSMSRRLIGSFYSIIVYTSSKPIT